MLFFIKENIIRHIRNFIDFFYPPFEKYMTLQFFRYGFTGSINLLFDWVLYYFIYTFVLRHQMLHIGHLAIGSHIGTLLIKMPIILLIGFLLQKYITFSYSSLQGRIQLFRYAVVFGINVLINYAGLKLLVEYFKFYPTISNMLVSLVTVLVSYLTQKHYTFKHPK